MTANYNSPREILGIYNGVIESVFVPIVEHRRITSNSIGYGLAVKQRALKAYRAADEKCGQAATYISRAISELGQIDVDGFLKTILKPQEAEPEAGTFSVSTDGTEQFAQELLKRGRDTERKKLYDEASTVWKLSNEIRLLGNCVSTIYFCLTDGPTTNLVRDDVSRIDLVSSVRNYVRRIEIHMQMAIPFLDDLQLEADVGGNEALLHFAAGSAAVMDFTDLRKGSIIYDLI